MLPSFLKIPAVAVKIPEEKERVVLSQGYQIAVTWRRNPQAKRVILRLVPFQEAVVVVLPRGVGKKEGLCFLREKADWVAEKFAARLATVPFVDGAVLPFKGREITIVHRDDLRGARLVNGQGDGRSELIMGGAPAHLSRRVKDWLKARAREELNAHIRPMAAELEKSVGRLTLRDTTSRWGSCSAVGNLSFSWRLILAPCAVLRYVAAHEVAHLVRGDHSPAFWNVVEDLVGEVESEKKWLKSNGNSLHRYGV